MFYPTFLFQSAPTVHSTKRIANTFIAFGLATVGIGSGFAADNAPPAGQVCPIGAFVTGFDADGNILCGRPGEPAQPTAERLAPVAGTAEPTPPPEQPAPATSREATVSSGAVPNSVPAIDELKPWSVAWGSDEATITILGNGFNAQSTVIFQGVVYQPSVDSAGDRLEVTLHTRGLAIGRYPITVSNGPDRAHTLPGAFYVY